MSLLVTYFHIELPFKRPAQTSRGILYTKHSWIITMKENSVTGWGECSVIPDLSPDFITVDEYEIKIQSVVHQLNNGELTIENATEVLCDSPSILFGVQSAFLAMKNGGGNTYFDNDFSRGQQKIPINGLIWMGNEQSIRQQIRDKISNGFSTIKIKISAQSWSTDLEILQSLRKQFDELTLRVDANGGFSPRDIPTILEELNRLNVHSIEQPIAPKQWKHLSALCANTPTPIALDEELIGVNKRDEKEQLLTFIRPHFIILKPSLHGGISGVNEWIELAEKHAIGWWMTSALESNIGLKTICDFTAQYKNPLPHGLGTGRLYARNFETSLIVKNGYIWVGK